MRICDKHWVVCKTSVEKYGMMSLVSTSGEQAMEKIEKEIKGEAHLTEDFDPLLSMSNHFYLEALRCGGLYLMEMDGHQENNGHYCPLCEFERHYDDFNVQDAVDSVASQMATWCRSENLIPKIN